MHKSLLLFKSAEALFIWLSEPSSAFNEAVTHIDIEPNEFVEAEWYGCEFMGQRVCLDYIRLAKARPTQNTCGEVLGTYLGWTTSDMMPFFDREDEYSYTQVLQTSDTWKLDLGILFNDDKVAWSHAH